MVPASFYLKLLAVVLALICGAVGYGYVKHWYSDAAKVPALEMKLMMLNEQYQNTLVSFTDCRQAVARQNAAIDDLNSQTILLQDKLDKAKATSAILIKQRDAAVERIKSLDLNQMTCEDLFKAMAEEAPKEW